VYFLTRTLAAFGVGRVTSAYLMRFLAPYTLLGVYAVANVGLIGIGVLWPGWIRLWAVFLSSFFMSLMFPTIFAVGLKSLGPNTKVGGSLIVVAIVGGAVLTPLMGLIAEAHGSIALAYLVPLVAYVFIAAYAFLGLKPDIPKQQREDGFDTNSGEQPRGFDHFLLDDERTQFPCSY
jgi:FHS family L-fucose permease-like MFS transporter